MAKVRCCWAAAAACLSVHPASSLRILPPLLPAGTAGVHLHISFVKKLMGRHPDVLPFLVHIASEGKHVERMAVRAKYMTLDPHKNRCGMLAATAVCV